MTVAYWCVLAAGILPYAWIILAKSAPGMDNAAPRAFVDTLTGWRQRAVWAERNAFEALPLFIAAVVIAHLAGVPQARIDGLALAFIALRIAHGALYIANRPSLRSLAWALAFACMVALFVLAARV